MTATLHIENSVRDFDSWKQTFDKYDRFRLDGHVRRHRVSRRVDDQGSVMIDLDFDTVEEATAFHERLRKVWASPQSQAELAGHAQAVVYDVLEQQPAPSPRVDTQGMVLIHRVMRREFGLLPGMVRRAAGRPSRARTVAAHAEEMLDFLHTHHTGEDELLWPVLGPRVELAQELVARMEAQHEQVAAYVDQIRSALRDWAGSADENAGERVATGIEQMTAVLTEHLDEEESAILPLVACSLSQAEWDALAAHGFAAVPSRRRLAMLGHILEDVDASERAHMMAKVPPPARLAYRVVGRRRHQREVAALRG